MDCLQKNDCSERYCLLSFLSSADYMTRIRLWASYCGCIYIFHLLRKGVPRQGLFFVYAAHFLRPLCGDSACLFCSPRTEHLLIYRIQSHTHPKRRKFCLKHAGQKSIKEELPEQRKGPKRAAECRLKVPTHVWEQDAGSSSLPTRTIRSIIKGSNAVLVILFSLTAG